MIPAPYSSGDKTSFAYSTIHERLPAIFKQIAADLKQEVEQSSDLTSESKTEAGEIVTKVEQMITDFRENAELTPIEELHAHDAAYNEELKKLAPLHYHDAPWLYFECYAYRKVQQIFDMSTHWSTYDMFGRAKDSTFGKSESAVGELAARYVLVEQQVGDIKSKPLAEQLKVLEVLFHEVAMTALWGNATDLSLLVSIDLEQIKKLQVASAERDKNTIISNDLDKVWAQMRSSMGGRVDIVLDNAGFELYTDLILTLFLLDTGLAEQVVLHPKSQPWFVSDVTPRDWLRTAFLLNDKSQFPSHREAVDKVLERIMYYQAEGQIIMRTSAYWTLGAAFWDIVENGKNGGHEVWQDLRASKLVLFKGDLNYRKLTGDVAWPRDTPFKTAIQGLANNGIPMVTFRTCKSDVTVGLPSGKEEELEEVWAKSHDNKYGWAWSGQYAVISFSQ